MENKNMSKYNKIENKGLKLDELRLKFADVMGEFGWYYDNWGGLRKDYGDDRLHRLKLSSRVITYDIRNKEANSKWYKKTSWFYKQIEITDEGKIHRLPPKAKKPNKLKVKMEKPKSDIDYAIEKELIVLKHTTNPNYKIFTFEEFCTEFKVGEKESLLAKLREDGNKTKMSFGNGNEDYYIEYVNSAQDILFYSMVGKEILRKF